MTILAGFSCVDGVVICGDTQETVANFSKRNVTKVKVVPEFQGMSKLFGGTDLAASFCGAGDGPFIDMLTRKAWAAAEDSTSLIEASSAVEATIKGVYAEYLNLYQPGQCPVVDLIYGLKMDGESRLFSANGPVVNDVDGMCSGGVGYYMADFLAARMYTRGLALYKCVILALISISGQGAR